MTRSPASILSAQVGVMLHDRNLIVAKRRRGCRTTRSGAAREEALDELRSLLCEAVRFGQDVKTEALIIADEGAASNWPRSRLSPPFRNPSSNAYSLGQPVRKRHGLRSAANAGPLQ